MRVVGTRVMVKNSFLENNNGWEPSRPWSWWNSQSSPGLGSA